MTEPVPSVLNDDPNAMSAEDYWAASDPALHPELTNHEIPEDVLQEALAKAVEADDSEVEVPDYDGEPVDLDGEDGDD